MFAATLPCRPGDESAPQSHQGLSAIQRTRGALRLGFRLRGAATTPTEFYQEGALKARLPRVYDTAPEAVMINTAGGLTGGDAVSVVVRMEADAAAVVTGQACEKIYKSSGGDVAISSVAHIHPRAALEWLVQPTIIFDRARLRRTMSVDMAASASFLGLEAIVLGRTAMSEEVAAGFISDSWRIRRNGTLIYADTFHLDGDIAAAVANPAVLAGCRALATVIYVAPDAETRRDEMREIVAGAQGTAAVSAWNGLMVARFAAPDGYTLTHDLVSALTQFRKRPMPRVWMI